MKSAVAVGLIALILTAGCTTFSDSPTEQERPVTVVLNNSANETQAFEVWVVDLPANVSTRRNDGLTATYPLGEGLVTTEPGDGYFYTTVEPPESAQLHGRYTLEPGEENQSSIEKFPRDFAVVVVAYQDENHIIEWVSANCADQALVGLEVTSRHIKTNADVFASYGCR
jgi:hypothetical protein